MDLPDNGGMVPATLDSLVFMDARDARYLFGAVHDDAGRPFDSLTNLATPLTDLSPGLGNVFIGTRDLGELAIIGEDSSSSEIVRLAVGQRLKGHRAEKYFAHKLQDGEDFGTYLVTGITALDIAQNTERNLGLKLLAFKDLNVDTQIARRFDGTYEVRVTAYPDSPEKIKKVARVLSGLVVEDTTIDTMARNLANKFNLSSSSQNALNLSKTPKNALDAQGESYYLDDVDVDDLAFSRREAEHAKYTRHRGRAGFSAEDLSFSGKRKVQRAGSEVYDRQMRIAGQIADAMNSASEKGLGYKSPNYTKAEKLLATLRRDISKHGSMLFMDNNLARYFVNAVSEAITNWERVAVTQYNRPSGSAYAVEKITA